MRKLFYCMVVMLVIFCVSISIAQPEIELFDPGDIRARALDLMKKNQYEEAYTIFSKLVLSPDEDINKLNDDLSNAIKAGLRTREKDIDSIREKARVIYSNNWRGLYAVAKSYQDAGFYTGYLKSGKFTRYSIQNAKIVYTDIRDHVIALQLMSLAEKQMTDATVREAGDFYLYYADIFFKNRYRLEPFLFTSLVDYSRLPDYATTFSSPYRLEFSGRPVDSEGNPVFYNLPVRWEDAKNNGERWRWLLKKAADVDPELTDESVFRVANFAYEQFGTINLKGVPPIRYYEDNKIKNIYNMQTLKDDETIARMANGKKRLKLPNDYNFIKIYKEMANGNGKYKESAINSLINIYHDRRQVEQELIYAKMIKSEYVVNLITGNLGELQPVGVQQYGKKATAKFRFRNGNEVHFTVFPVDIKKLIEDEIKGERIGKYRLYDLAYNLALNDGLKDYIGTALTEWDMKLTPKPEYVDSIVTITTPLINPGLYILKSKMKDGNESRIPIWIVDTAIIFKPLKDGALVYTADVVTGKALGNTQISFFGNMVINDSIGYNPNRKIIPQTKELETDENGILIIPSGSIDYQWVSNFLPHDGERKIVNSSNWIVTTVNGNRFAYQTFGEFNTYPWNGLKDKDNATTKVKSFIITDRLTYKPGDTVKFKAWISSEDYNQKGNNPCAGKSINLKIYSPSAVIYNKDITTDNYGGVEGEYQLKEDDVDGNYGIFVNSYQEEYWRQSFKVDSITNADRMIVTIDIPRDVILTGDTAVAKIKAQYSDGRPVTNAVVQYVVIRSDYTPTWYPADQWDWLYNNGYSWLPSDYDWYPGWDEWGCRKPIYKEKDMNEMPLIVEHITELNVPIGPNGTVDITFDTIYAKEMQNNTDHKYIIAAKVIDNNKTGTGFEQVMAVRKPFNVYAWMDKGYYHSGDQIRVNFNAHTVTNQPIKGIGEIKMLRISYKDDDTIETPVYNQVLNTDSSGLANIRLTAGEVGQYRISYTVIDTNGNHVEGGCIFNVCGDNMKPDDFRFNGLELIPDKHEYSIGDNVKLLINANTTDSDILLFIKPANDVNKLPKLIRMKGKSTIVSIPVTDKDTPNFFVEAVSVGSGLINDEVREIAVPPTKKLLNVEIIRQNENLVDDGNLTLKLKITDQNGKPAQAQAVISIYNSAVDDFAQQQDIKRLSWEFHRLHTPYGVFNLSGYEGLIDSCYHNRLNSYTRTFGNDYPNLLIDDEKFVISRNKLIGTDFYSKYQTKKYLSTSDYPLYDYFKRDFYGKYADIPSNMATVKSKNEFALVRRDQYAGTAFWKGSLESTPDGIAEISCKIPKEFVGWKMKCWVMGKNGAVGSAETEGKKTLLMTVSTPKFLTQNDEASFNVNIHNFLPVVKKVRVSVEVDGKTILSLDGKGQIANNNIDEVEISGNSVKSVSFRIRATQVGTAVVRIKAATDVDSDLVIMNFPVKICDRQKSVYYNDMISSEEKEISIDTNTPAGSVMNNRLEIRWSPSIVGVIIDALAYLYKDHHECAEERMYKMTPLVSAQKALINIGYNLNDIKNKRIESGKSENKPLIKDPDRWSQFSDNMLFDENEVTRMVKFGNNNLGQHHNGGFGVFGQPEDSGVLLNAAIVMHGLSGLKTFQSDGLLKQNTNYGLSSLKKLQAVELQHIDMWQNGVKKFPGKQKADAVDAFVYMVLAEMDADNITMRQCLYDNLDSLPVYARVMFCIALHIVKDIAKRDAVMADIEKYLVVDAANKTAYLKLPAGDYWGKWYDGEYDAQAFYLKLLTLTDPKGAKAAGVAKYLLTNRKHATYWNSTRDTAYVIEALMDYLQANGEEKPNMNLQVFVDNKLMKTVDINADNIFTVDNKLVLEGDNLSTGTHVVKLVKKGTGPLYFSAKTTGLTRDNKLNSQPPDIKINRKYYRIEKTALLNGNASEYTRTLIDNTIAIKVGDIIEVELEIESKNEYEYLLLEDVTPAGFHFNRVRNDIYDEQVALITNYLMIDKLTSNASEVSVAAEYNESKVSYVIRSIAPGINKISYSISPEIPGIFNAAPATLSALYAPELQAASDNSVIVVKD